MTDDTLSMNLPVSTNVETPATNEISDDFTQVRGNLKEIIQTGHQAVAEVAQLADQSQSPRFYEALSSLMKASIDANRELIDLYKKKKELVREGPSHVTNQLILTSAQLLEMLKEGEK